MARTCGNVCAVPLDVLHVLPTAQRRGAETFALELHQQLGARGHRSTAVALEPGPVSGRRLPVQTFGPGRFSPSGMRALRIAAKRSAVVVAHGSSTLLACGVALAGTSVPFVYTNIGDPRYWAPAGARRARVGFLLDRAAAVAAICPPARDILVEHFSLSPAKVRVVPNGRSGERFAPADRAEVAAARHQFELPAAGDVVAVVGALTPEKRVDVAIRTVAAVPDLRLVVAGDGTIRSRLEELAHREAPGRVTFIGSTDRPEQVFAAADAVLLTSASEGVPGVLIEAGLAALPVVATDVGWVSQVVVDGVTGRLVGPGDTAGLTAAVEEVLHDRVRLGAAARTHCLARFEIATVVSAWEELLRAVALRTRRRPATRRTR